MFFLTYYTYLIWQCYKVYVAVYFIFTFYGFSRMTIGVFWKAFSTVFGYLWRGLINNQNEKTNDFDDWLIVNCDDCKNGAIEMVPWNEKNKTQ